MKKPVSVSGKYFFRRRREMQMVRKAIAKAATRPAARPAIWGLVRPVDLGGVFCCSPLPSVTGVLLRLLSVGRGAGTAVVLGVEVAGGVYAGGVMVTSAVDAVVVTPLLLGLGTASWDEPQSSRVAWMVE